MTICSNKKVFVTAALCTLIATLLLLGGCNLSTQRYDLSRPVNDQDWLMIWEEPADVNTGAFQTPDFRIRVGQPIFGYEAPLSNYIPIYPIGAAGGDTVQSWIDLEAPAMYFLSLFEDKSDDAITNNEPSYDRTEDANISSSTQDLKGWRRTLLVWREQHAALVAHSFDEPYLQYLSALDYLTSQLQLDGKLVQDHQIYWTWIGIFVLVDTDEGSYGKFFSDYAVLENQDVEYSFEELKDRILPESEIVHIIESLYQFHEEQIPVHGVEGMLDEDGNIIEDEAIESR